MQPTQTLVCLLRLGYLDELAVPSAVQLGPGAPHSGPFAVVQHGEVHPRPVSCPPHQAVQGIHLGEGVAKAWPSVRLRENAQP